MEPSIFSSRKFYIMVVDVVVSLVTYFTGKYLNPESAKDILFLIGALQPIVLLVVGSIALQNVTAIKAEGNVQEALAYKVIKLPPLATASGEPVGLAIPAAPVDVGKPL